MDSFSVTLPMPELEAPELICTKGPSEKPLRGPPPSDLASQPAVQLLETSEEDQVFVGEDEMAKWLHYFCDTNDNSLLPVLPGRASESHFQVPPPVLLGKDGESDGHAASSEARNYVPSMCTAKASTLGMRGVGRKGKEKLNFEGNSEVTNIGSNEKRKDALPKSMASRKLRATEVHNLSERRRRCRINEKMKILQELIPASNKLDKASMLDEAIAYVKFLQMQVKMMPMGCSIRPPIFPSGSPPYMQSMPSSMGIGMGMNRGITPFGPAIPYPHINQPIQFPMLQMRHQHDMAPGMFPCSHAGDPYHFPVVVPGHVEVSPQNGTANKKMEKRKQATKKQ